MSGKRVCGKPELEKLIEAQDIAVSFSVPRHATSPLWAKFIKVHVSSEAHPFSQCNDCRRLIHWNASDGTNGMVKPTCQIPRSSQSSLTLIITFFKQNALVGLISSMKKKIAIASAECARLTLVLSVPLKVTVSDCCRVKSSVSSSFKYPIYLLSHSRFFRKRIAHRFRAR
jgi:hypothetical protein